MSKCLEIGILPSVTDGSDFGVEFFIQCQTLPFREHNFNGTDTHTLFDSI